MTSMSRSFESLETCYSAMQKVHYGVTQTVLAMKDAVTNFYCVNVYNMLSYFTYSHL